MNYIFYRDLDIMAEIEAKTQSDAILKLFEQGFIQISEVEKDE